MQAVGGKAPNTCLSTNTSGIGLISCLGLLPAALSLMSEFMDTGHVEVYGGALAGHHGNIIALAQSLVQAQ